MLHLLTLAVGLVAVKRRILPPSVSKADESSSIRTVDYDTRIFNLVTALAGPRSVLRSSAPKRVGSWRVPSIHTARVPTAYSGGLATWPAHTPLSLIQQPRVLVAALPNFYRSGGRQWKKLASIPKFCRDDVALWMHRRFPMSLASKATYLPYHCISFSSASSLLPLSLRQSQWGRAFIHAFVALCSYATDSAFV